MNEVLTIRPVHLSLRPLQNDLSAGTYSPGALTTALYLYKDEQLSMSDMENPTVFTAHLLVVVWRYLAFLGHLNMPGRSLFVRDKPRVEERQQGAAVFVFVSCATKPPLLLCHLEHLLHVNVSKTLICSL